jgi:hypothetical protein
VITRASVTKSHVGLDRKQVDKAKSISYSRTGHAQCCGDECTKEEPSVSQSRLDPRCRPKKDMKNMMAQDLCIILGIHCSFQSLAAVCVKTDYMIES